jgi:cytidyltransferase-like protein|tara:strand:- start:3127 stop:3885 length:759 start_codon:yes stop_codon:yes gene_type:complete
MKPVIVTGGFDPLHSGHIAYFKAAKELGSILFVGVNSDEWLTRKKGRPFMSVEERMAIIKEIGCVGHVFTFNDQDDTAINAIEYVKKQAPVNSNIVFANGGDRTKENIPEMVFDDVEFVFGIGGEDKKNSSSWILKEWDKPTTSRLWGKYRDLDQNGHWKVKELSIDVGKSLSDQKHFIRSEHWHIVDGDLKMDLEFSDGYSTSKVYGTGDSIDIPSNTWHHATNVGDKPVKVIEVWMGNTLSEDDIERRYA